MLISRMSELGPAEQFGEALRAALRAGKFPNPTREGCPDERLIKQMAAKRGALPVGHSTHAHIMQCSPCYQQLEIYRAQYRGRRTLAVAASVLVVLGAGYGAYHEWPQAESLIARNHSAVDHATVDLRPYTVERSDRAPSSVPPPVQLPACRVQATLHLPVGTEPGPYEFRILDSELKTRVSAAAAATIENFETTVRVTMDLTALMPGKYTLAMRRTGDDWRHYPLLIHPAM